jgi:hypothetical protein
VALHIPGDKAISVLERAATLARDPDFAVSELWDGRVAALEAWKGNKLALTVFATAILARATEPSVDPLSLIDRSGDPKSYNARLFARDVLVPEARRLQFLLGTPGPDPLAGSPWFGPERISDIDKWRAKSKRPADDLQGWLAGLDEDSAQQALVAFIRRRSAAFERRVDERRGALVSEGPVVALEDLGREADRFMRRNPEYGRRGAAAAAAAFDAAGRRVVARPVHDPGQIDVDVLDSDGLLWLGIEIKQQPARAQDATDIVEGARALGATRAILCAFGQYPERLASEATLAEHADRQHGVVLHIVYSTAELLRLAALSSALTRPAIAKRFPRAYGDYLAALDAEQSALDQWKAITERWQRATESPTT